MMEIVSMEVSRNQRRCCLVIFFIKYHTQIGLACSAGVFWVGETLFVTMAISGANCALKENACTAG